MPINFVSTTILAFLLGVMETNFIVHGLYLIFSKQTMVKNDFAPNQPLRRLGGYILLFLALSYIYTCRLIPQIPHWGEEGGDVWVPYLNRDTLLYSISLVWAVDNLEGDPVQEATEDEEGGVID